LSLKIGSIVELPQDVDDITCFDVNVDVKVLQKNFSQKITHSVGAHGQVKLAKSRENMPSLWSHPQKTPNPKRNNFFFNLN